MSTVQIMADNAPALEGLWLTVSELARQRGVDKAAISRRITRLGLELRPGPRNSKLVNVAAFDHAVGTSTDAVRAANSAKAAAREQEASAGEDKVLAREQARRAAYDADLKKLDLDERLGKLLPVDSIEDAMSRCAEAMVRNIDQIASRADDLAAAVARDGGAGARRELKVIARELRETLARELRLLETATQPELDKPSADA